MRCGTKKKKPHFDYFIHGWMTGCVKRFGVLGTSKVLYTNTGHLPFIPLPRFGN